MPRSSHAAWKPPAHRPNVVDLLRAADRGRVPTLLPIRYGRMMISPFGFLRGTASVMARDLASTPVTGLMVQLCGDAHLCNFGVFGTPERQQVFDVNDFDETLEGPWEWDVKRLATSFVVAGRQNRYPRTVVREAARTVLSSYREMLARFAAMRYLDVWYFHLDVRTPPLPEDRVLRKLMGRAAGKARRRTGLHAFPGLTRSGKGRPRIQDDPPLIVHYRSSTAEEISRSLYDRYLRTLPDERRMLLDRYHVADVAQKVVGVGSVGLECSVLLLLGDSDLEDPLLLQLKQATTSALEPYLGASPYDNHAQRVVVGQHLIQETSDVFLGWGRLGTRDFYVRQLRDMKFSYDISSLGPREFLGQAELCGTALARAHARTGDPAGISGYLGSGGAFDRAVTEFAELYADQTERDYETLRQAARRGRLPVSVDV
ncbi:MAG TPA: DUF2252 domain-containing protein [Thermoplasmata archaeon]|nr:DUF2252 domain-containing protein [Thermoplasmata archaeon]